MASIRTAIALVSVAAGAALFFAPSTAHAGIEACGNINVRAEANCKVEAQGGCTVNCTPVKFEAACAGKLEVQCSGAECKAEASLDCQGSCTGTCEGQCEAKPGSFDCQGSCEGSCNADCSGKCSAEANKGECEASCKATCSGSCSGQCEGTPPEATCEGKCQASCEGSCEGKANIDCQIDCQAKGYAECKASLEGGCKAKCSEPSGALFCDGQYVDTGNNLQNCVDALNAYLKVKVEASGSAGCDGGTCSAEGKASATCGAAPIDSSADGAVFAFGALGLVGAVAASRRRRPAKRG
jgi:modification target Cys-rich repeat protein